MPLLDALCNAFGTAGTGGFAIRNDSFASYSAYTQTVTTVFMALFGVNFSIYFFLLRRKFDLAWKNTELRWYVSIILGSTLLITCNIMKLYGGDFGYSLHHAAFTVSSVITTTGFGTENFDLWPEFSRVILVLLMIVGASAGSTGGGLKVSRVVILMRAAKAELRKILHPHTVKVITVDGKPVSGETVRAVSTYFILYVLIAAASVLLVSLDGYDGSTTLTAVMATFNNIGPGLGLCGPAGNFAFFSPFAKVDPVPRYAARAAGAVPDAGAADAEYMEKEITAGFSLPSARCRREVFHGGGSGFLKNIVDITPCVPPDGMI